MKNEMYFYRWGELNPVKHKEARKADEDSWYHIAPVYKGIYAFPRGYIDEFLVSGSYTNHSLRKFMNENDEEVDENDFYEKDYKTPIKVYKDYIKKHHIKRRDIIQKRIPIPGTEDEEGYPDYRFPMYYRVRPKKFKYTGDLWHHLGDYCNKNDIMASKHGWVKTSYKVWLKALHKCHTLERFETYMRLSKIRSGNPHGTPSFYGKEHYEVFIEHLK